MNDDLKFTNSIKIKLRPYLTASVAIHLTLIAIFYFLAATSIKPLKNSNPKIKITKLIQNKKEIEKDKTVSNPQKHKIKYQRSHLN